MKIAIVSDIHGNLLFLQKCLEQLDKIGCEQIICLGDTAGYFPDFFECMSILKERKAVHLLGNHEAMLVGILKLSSKSDEIYGLSKIKLEAQSNLFKEISTFLPFLEIDIRRKKILFVHGSPFDPIRGYIYPDSNVSFFWKSKYDVVFMGHTHRPFYMEKGWKRIINVGSCGLPRDVGNSPSFAVFDTDNDTIDIVRIKCSVDEVLKKYQEIHSKTKNCILRGECTR